MTLEAYNYLISGRVQGVGFRWFTEREARRLGVCGFVRNLPDGRVEVHAQAVPSALVELEASLRRGPAMANVNGLDKQPVAVDDSLTGFDVLHHGWGR